MEIHPSENDRYKQKKRYRIATIGACVIVMVGGGMTLSQYAAERAGNPQSPERQYPLHENVTATVFWVGEGASTANDFIHNRSSAWMTDWVAAYGGVDKPDNRCSFMPCAFTPKENPFYFALPFSDYDENGVKSGDELAVVPWHDGSDIAQGSSILKNRWIEVTYNDKKAYGQWEDVGPFVDDDADYVFGSSEPKESRAGLDLSPALTDYLGINGRAVVSWNFIDESDVPEGEWKKTITRSDPLYTP